jgi:hypothetical protein
MRLLLFVVTLNVICLNVSGQEIIWDHSDSTILRRAILLKGPDFTSRNLEMLGTRILKEAVNHQLIDIRFVAEISQANLFPRPSHLSYDDFVRFHNRVSKTIWQFANLISIQGHATLRIRNGQEIVRRVLTAGRDPLRWSINDSSLEIVYLSYSDHSIIKRINVFAVAKDNLSIVTCRQFYSMLKVALPRGFGYLAVRRDPWFMNDEFPIGFWFDSGQPPSKRELDNAPLVECTEVDRSVECSSYGVPKP